MIEAAAIKFYFISDSKREFPQIMTARRHGDILSKMNHLPELFDNSSAEQGFLTDDNKFLNRFQARAHALLCGQISEEVFKETGRYGGLYSEDIWPEE